MKTTKNIRRPEKSVYRSVIDVPTKNAFGICFVNKPTTITIVTEDALYGSDTNILTMRCFWKLVMKKNRNTPKGMRIAERGMIFNNSVKP